MPCWVMITGLTDEAADRVATNIGFEPGSNTHKVGAISMSPKSPHGSRLRGWGGRVLVVVG